MHVLKSHEVNFSKVVSDPFILKLFDIVTEPNMNIMESSGIPCPLCPKKFSRFGFSEKEILSFPQIFHSWEKLRQKEAEKFLKTSIPGWLT